MARRSPWSAFLSGRDPQPDVEPAVVMVGCRHWVAADSFLHNPNCPVCKGSIRPQDEEFYCAECDRTDPSGEAILAAARKHTRKRPRPIKQPKPASEPKPSRKQRRAQARKAKGS